MIALTALRTLLALAAFGLAATACNLTLDEDDDYSDDGPVRAYESSLIDTGARIELPEPGTGAGVFVEYLGDGIWLVTTTCDAETSGGCDWDIIVRAPEGYIRTWNEYDLEPSDELFLGESSVRLIADTAFDSDTLEVGLDPGSPLSVDVVLDQGDGSRYLFWVGEGGLHVGAPANPMELYPSTP